MTAQALTLIGPPTIALALSSWLRDARLPRWLDTLIALLATLLTAFGWSLIADKLVSDPVADIVIIASYSAALIAGPMAALHEWLVMQLPSPFGAIMHAMSLSPSEEVPAQPAVIAPRITLPTTPELIQRNSLLGGDPPVNPA